MHIESKKIKIIQVTRSLNVGGLEKLVATLARNLNREVFDVSVVCLLRKGFFSGELESEGIRVHLVAESEPDARSRLLFLKLARFLKCERPDIVHTHNTHAMIDGTLASVLARVPVRVHTDHARQFPDRVSYMITENLLSRYVDRVVAVSERSKQDLVQFEKIAAKVISVVPNGADIDAGSWNRDQVRQELGLRGHEFLIGTVSRLTEQKGTRFLIEALPAIVATHPEIKLVVVGDGASRKNLENQVAQLTLDRYVVFVGYQKDTEKYLTAMDLYVLPSLWEGMPIGVIEAMACSKPIVATAVGGVPEIIEDGITGHLVPPGEATGLTGAVRKCLEDREKNLRMGLAARSRYEERFTVKTMVTNYESLFFDLVRSKGINCAAGL